MLPTYCKILSAHIWLHIHQDHSELRPCNIQNSRQTHLTCKPKDTRDIWAEPQHGTRTQCAALVPVALQHTNKGKTYWFSPQKDERYHTGPHRLFVHEQNLHPGPAVLDHFGDVLLHRQRHVHDGAAVTQIPQKNHRKKTTKSKAVGKNQQHSFWKICVSSDFLFWGDLSAELLLQRRWDPLPVLWRNHAKRIKLYVHVAVFTCVDDDQWWKDTAE